MLQGSEKIQMAAWRAIANLSHSRGSTFLEKIVNNHGFEVRGGLIGLVKYHGDGQPFLSGAETMCALANLTKSALFVSSLTLEHADIVGGSVTRFMKNGSELERCCAALSVLNIGARTAINVPFRLEFRRLHLAGCGAGLVGLLSNGTLLTKSYGLSTLAKLARTNPMAARFTVLDHMRSLQLSLPPLLEEGLTAEDRTNAACMIALYTESVPDFCRSIDVQRTVEQLRRMDVPDRAWPDRAVRAIESVHNVKVEFFGEEELC